MASLQAIFLCSPAFRRITILSSLLRHFYNKKLYLITISIFSDPEIIRSFAANKIVQFKLE